MNATYILPFTEGPPLVFPGFTLAKRSKVPGKASVTGLPFFRSCWNQRGEPGSGSR